MPGNPASKRVNNREELENLVVGEIIEHKLKDTSEHSLGEIVYAGTEKRGRDRFFIFIKKADFQKDGQVIKCIKEYAIDKGDVDEGYFAEGCLSFFDELLQADSVYQGDERFKRYDELLER